MRKLCLSTKFPHQKIRWNYGILRAVNDVSFLSNSNLFPWCKDLLVSVRLWATPNSSVLSQRSVPCLLISAADLSLLTISFEYARFFLLSYFDLHIFQEKGMNFFLWVYSMVFLLYSKIGKTVSLQYKSKWIEFWKRYRWTSDEHPSWNQMKNIFEKQECFRGALWRMFELL